MTEQECYKTIEEALKAAVVGVGVAGALTGKNEYQEDLKRVQTAIKALTILKRNYLPENNEKPFQG